MARDNKDYKIKSTGPPPLGTCKSLLSPHFSVLVASMLNPCAPAGVHMEHNTHIPPPLSLNIYIYIYWLYDINCLCFDACPNSQLAFAINSILKKFSLN